LEDLANAVVKGQIPGQRPRDDWLSGS